MVAVSRVVAVQAVRSGHIGSFWVTFGPAGLGCGWDCVCVHVCIHTVTGMKRDFQVFAQVAG